MAGVLRRRPHRAPAPAGGADPDRAGLRRRVPPGREHGPLGARRRCRWTRSTCSWSRTSATSSARPSSASARTSRRWSSSVTEGEDKPLKYPLMFRACELILVNKIDLLPHLDFDMDKLMHHLDAVQPGRDQAAGERPHGRGRRRLARLAGRRRRARVRRPERPRDGGGAGGGRRARRAPRARLPGDGRALPRAAAGCWRSGTRRPSAPTSATSPSSSSTR